MLVQVKKMQQRLTNMWGVMLPIAVAAIYGSFTVHLSSAFAKFVDRIGPMETIQFIGFALSAFGAVALWPALIQFGRGVPYRELQRRLQESEASVENLVSRSSELQNEVDTYAAELWTSSQRFTLVMKSFNIATFYCDREHRYEWSHNFTGDPESIIGKKDEEILDPEAAAVLTALKQRALEEEQLQEGQVVINEGDKAKRYLVQVAPRYDETKSCVGTLSVSTDITEKSLWQQHLLMMIDEVNHRARNMLSVILSILNLTSRSVTSAGAFHKKIYGRVLALSVSHSVISEDRWTASSLRHLIDRLIEKSARTFDDAIDIVGDDVYLFPKAIQNLGLAFHELLENAKEHGALSQPDGRVKLSWMPMQNGSFNGLVIKWEEQSSSTIQKPTQTGFGLRSLENLLLNELQGSGKANWTPEGLVFEIRLPNAMLATEHEQQDSSMSFIIDSRSKQKIEYAA